MDEEVRSCASLSLLRDFERSSEGALDNYFKPVLPDSLYVELNLPDTLSTLLNSLFKFE